MWTRARATELEELAAAVPAAGERLRTAFGDLATASGSVREGFVALSGGVQTSAAALTRRAPGSDRSGVPASEISAKLSPATSRATSVGVVPIKPAFSNTLP